MKRLILVLAACAAPPAKPVPVAHLPATPAGTQMQWVFDGLATPSKVDAAAIQSHFAPSFLAQVPAEQITGIFGEMSKLTTGLVLGEMSEKSPRELVVHITTAKDPLVFSITVDEHGQIAGLLARPEPLKSYDAAIAKLDANASQTQLLAAELDHGACKP
ncbi:MAG TPA: Cpe/LpqF family protein, partial [Kofleriaceae bacterium]